MQLSKINWGLIQGIPQVMGGSRNKSLNLCTFPPLNAAARWAMCHGQCNVQCCHSVSGGVSRKCGEVRIQETYAWCRGCSPSLGNTSSNPNAFAPLVLPFMVGFTATIILLLLCLVKLGYLFYNKLWILAIIPKTNIWEKFKYNLIFFLRDSIINIPYVNIYHLLRAENKIIDRTTSRL